MSPPRLFAAREGCDLSREEPPFSTCFHPEEGRSFLSFVFVDFAVDCPLAPPIKRSKNCANAPPEKSALLLLLLSVFLFLLVAF